jgi:hypothetical protein
VSSFNSLMGKAQAGDDLALARLIVKKAVMDDMFCHNPRCGRVLDQSSAAVFEFEHHKRAIGKSSVTLCPVCTRRVDLEARMQR